ncbi:hypothetical protein CLU79DRAFT_704511 [Phycomyces nitens]|nr:hypothetical protein CLU79DRAFT_704511 [Phycomyces nitens]
MLRSTLVVLAAFFAGTTLACEPDCRHGLANDFSKFYSPVLEVVFDQLSERLIAEATKPITIAEQLSAVIYEEDIRKDIRAIISPTVKNFEGDYAEKKVEDSIFKVMFAEENPFKGDCNTPKRIDRKMPPPGESWTREECEKMDYICGNPPSICHFLPDIKLRIVNRIRQQLSDYGRYQQGLLFRTLSQAYKQSVQGTMVKYGAGSMINDTSTMAYINTLISGIASAIDSWITEDVYKLCDDPSQEELCNGWDEQIIPEILKWP